MKTLPTKSFGTLRSLIARQQQRIATENGPDGRGDFSRREFRNREAVRRHREDDRPAVLQSARIQES